MNHGHSLQLLLIYRQLVRCRSVEGKAQREGLILVLT